MMKTIHATRPGVNDFHHSVVGDLTLTYNRMDLFADAGLTIMV
jgi:hypothetical protein